MFCALSQQLTMLAFASLLPLVRTRGTPSLAISTRRPRWRPRACAAPSSSPLPPPESEESVLRLLQSPEKGPQQRGLLLSRRLSPDARLRMLLYSIRSSTNEWIRSTAAVDLGQLWGADDRTRREAVDALLGLLRADSDFSIRAAAAAGCGYLADEEHVAARDKEALSEVVSSLIRGWMEDHEWQVQFSCLVSLGCLRDPRARPVLAEALKSDNDLIVQGAVGACGDLGDMAMVPPLLDCLASDDMMTRQRLAQTLGRFPESSLEPAVVDALVTLTADPCFAVRDAATDSLGRYGVPVPERVGDAGLSDEERIEREVTALLQGNVEEQTRKATVDAAAEASRRRLERSFGKESVPHIRDLNATQNRVDDSNDDEDSNAKEKGEEGAC